LVIAGMAATVRWAAIATSPALPWLCLLQALQGISASRLSHRPRPPA
jgi:hypothetical protein